MYIYFVYLGFDIGSFFSVTGDAGPAVSCSCGEDQLYQLHESHSLNEVFIVIKVPLCARDHAFVGFL